MGTDDVDGHLVILFIALSILLGLITRHCCQLYRLPVPYEVLILTVGAVFGLLLFADNASHDADDVVTSLHLAASLDPNLLLFCFLPILLFDSAFSINFHTLRTVIAPTLLLAIPGVVVVALLTGCLIFLLFPASYGFSLLQSLLLGSLLAATDPVSTVAILKELGAFEQVTTIIEAESLLNDGVAFVLYELFLDILLNAAKHCRQ